MLLGSQGTISVGDSMSGADCPQGGQFVYPGVTSRRLCLENPYVTISCQRVRASAIRPNDFHRLGEKCAHHCSLRGKIDTVEQKTGNSPNWIILPKTNSMYQRLYAEIDENCIDMMFVNDAPHDFS
jgi:hypothetical protein